MTIRHFRPTDQDAVRRLILEGLGEHFGFVDKSANPDLDDIQANYVDCGAFFFVAQEKDEIVGTGCLLRESETEGRIVRMSTAKSHRRTGVASRLLDAIVHEARDCGMESIVIATEPHWADAVGFYQSKGFVPYGRDDVDIFMRLKLK